MDPVTVYLFVMFAAIAAGVAASFGIAKLIVDVLIPQVRNMAIGVALSTPIDLINR